MSFLTPKMPALPPPPPPPPAAPSFDDAERKAEAKTKQDELLRKRKGRASTILTSRTGLTEEADSEKKTLLGG
ncbi:MAG: hypothetical protein HKN40_02155 [Winogradskyella sp.]|uniref:hypothetical protein n=1 Tax=Winogradskyella sp. TaxID=1883156 RepID=UPI0018265823|nr:hypothetical protein [Winogradskyella sp.]|tara:strand:- start:3194 stop:3412 length:219 start_codon:yes stop_codon:yes gene_type:complete